MRKDGFIGTFWFKVTCVSLLISALLLTSGCSRLTEFLSMIEPAPSTESITESTAGSTTESTVPADDGASLNALRQAMVDAPQILAAAYLGFHYEPERAGGIDPFLAMEQVAPGLCADLPFLLAVEHIIGEEGELYCIVPADPSGSIAINRGTWDDTAGECVYDEVVYRSESGDPVLLFCNAGGFEPDMQVTVTDAAGNTAVWYPRLDDNRIIDMPLDDDWVEQLFDFSPYAEMLAVAHTELLTEGWKKPVAEKLIGTAWGYEQFLSDDRLIRGQLIFNEGTCSVRWNDGFDEMNHEYPDAQWTLTDQGAYAVLSIDFREFAGVLRYNLLMEEETGELYVSKDVSTGDVETGWEPLFRYLYAQTPDPEPMDMVGSWTILWTEFEGYRDFPEAGSQTIVITGTSEVDLRISYTDIFDPNSDYADKRLTLMNCELYYGCGNESWCAEVEHVGPYETSYTVTLLKDGTLLLQNYWEVDGSLNASYCCFQRAE